MGDAEFLRTLQQVEDTGGPPSITEPKRRPDSIDDERLDSHARMLPWAWVGSVVAAAMLWALTAERVAPESALRWLLSMATVWLGLAGLGIAHWRLGRVRPGPRAWLAAFRAGAALHGLAWGAGGVLLFVPDSGAQQAMLLMVLAGVAAAGAAMMPLDLAATLLFVLPLLTPAGLRLATATGGQGLAVAGLMAMYAAIVAASAARSQAQRRLVLALRAREVERHQRARQDLKLLEHMARLARVGGWSVDLRTDAVHLSAQAGRILGRQAAAVPRIESLVDCFAAPDRPDVALALRRAAEEGRPFVLERQVLPAEGGPQRWVAIVGAAVRKAGTVVRVDGAIQDIDRRVAAQRALLESEEQLRAIVDNVHDGIVAIDGAGMVTMFNRGAERIFGHAADDVIGRSVGMLMPESERQGHAGYVAARRMGRGVSKVIGAARELTGLRQDGSTFAMELTVSEAERDGQTHFIALMRDISQRKAAEAALREAKEAAERANRAKSAFLAHMSHEIRTPMNGVLGMVELLALSPMSEAQRGYVDTLRRSGRALLALLNDILDLSKIESGRLELEHERFDLRRTVQDCVDLMAPSASLKGLALRLEIDAALPRYLVGDAMRLQQVINNLVGNAVKFTDRGEVAISMTAEPALGRGGIRLCVADTGPGIDPARAESLFAPFEQGDSAISRRHGGTGLGLTIARHIARAMGGEMKAEPRATGGALFCFTARFDYCGEQEAPQESVLHDGADLAPVRSCRVLLAEDNPVNQMYAEAVLQRLGHAVHIVADGHAAVSAALADPGYDLVLMDCHMPGLDGFEATRRIREHEGSGGGPRRRIVALSASAMAEDRQRCRDCGMDDLLVKPYSIEQMRELLARAGVPA